MGTTRLRDEKSLHKSQEAFSTGLLVKEETLYFLYAFSTFSFVCIFEAHTLSRIRDVYIYVVYVFSSGFAVFSTLLLNLIV